MTMTTFLNIVFHKTPLEDDLTSFVEDIKLADINKYWENKPGGTEAANIDKNALIEKMKKQKMVGCNFVRVREVSRKQRQKNPYYGIRSCHLLYDLIQRVCRNLKCFKA
jgi:hypothetical protein